MAVQRPAIVWLRHRVGRGDLPAIGREVREAARHGLEFRLWLDHGSPAVRREIEDWWPSVPDTVVHSGPARGPGAALLGPLLDPSGEIYLKNESKKIRLPGPATATRPRPPGPPGSYALRTIGAVHREIGRTSVGPSYRWWLEEDRGFLEALARYYPRRVVDDVRRRALRGLEGRV